LSRRGSRTSRNESAGTRGNKHESLFELSRRNSHRRKSIKSTEQIEFEKQSHECTFQPDTSKSKLYKSLERAQVKPKIKEI
jgi:hypothetical protein